MTKNYLVEFNILKNAFYGFQEILLLTTTSLSGGWVPGMSKGFHFWQPAPRLNNAAPMAGTTLQPSHEPPRTRDKSRHPSHWKTVERKGREGGGGGRELEDECCWPHWLTELHALPNLCHMSETPHDYACASNWPLTAGTDGALCC